MLVGRPWRSDSHIILKQNQEHWSQHTTISLSFKIKEEIILKFSKAFRTEQLVLSTESSDLIYTFKRLDGTF